MPIRLSTGPLSVRIDNASLKLVWHTNQPLKRSRNIFVVMVASTRPKSKLTGNILSEGVLFEELIARDHEPLDEANLRDELNKKEEFAEDVRDRRVNNEELIPKNEIQVDFDREFVERYEYSLVGEAVVNGHSCWIIYLVPRDGDLSASRNIDNALNNSTGHLSISKEDFGLVRVEFQMARSVRFWWGLLGTLRDTKGQLEFTRVADGVWLPSLVDIQSDLRILFRSIRRRIVRQWNDYAPIGASD